MSKPTKARRTVAPEAAASPAKRIAPMVRVHNRSCAAPDAEPVASVQSEGIAPPADIIELMTSPAWLGDMFPGETWFPWIVFLRAVFGLPMSPDELAFF